MLRKEYNTGDAPISPREILRCAQDDSAGVCHPERSEGSVVHALSTGPTHRYANCHPERSEGSLARIRPADLTKDKEHMEPEFHLAYANDIDKLVEFMRQFYAIDQYPLDVQAARTTLEKIVGDPSLGRVWLINHEDEAIGYLVVTFGYSLEYHGRDAFIDELFVTTTYRNQGIGTKAIEFVLEMCPELGIHALHLEVERTNTAGQALYRKFGFENHDRYLMTRWISS